MADDIVDPFEGIVDPFANKTPAAPKPKGDFSWGQAITDIPSEIGKEFTGAVDDVKALGRRGEMGPVEGLLATGKAALAPVRGAFSPLVGTARSVAGHTMANLEHLAGEYLVNPVVEKMGGTPQHPDPEKMYETAKGDVDTALAAARPNQVPVKVAPAVPAPRGPYEIPAGAPAWELAPPPGAAAPAPPPIDRFGVTLTEGERTGNLAARQAEQGALRGQAGAPAQRHAEEFFNEQRPQQLEQARSDVARELDPVGRQELVANPNEAAQIGQQALQREFRRSKQGVTNEYERAKNFGGDINTDYFDNFTYTLKDNLFNKPGGGVVVNERTPNAANMVDYLNERIARLRIRNDIDPLNPMGAENGTITVHGPQGNLIRARPAGVSLEGVEEWRKTLSGMRNDARANAHANATDARAAQAVLDEFDNQINRAVNSGAFNGDPRAVRAWNDARAAHAEHMSKFGNDVVGKRLREVIDGGRFDDPASLDTVANHFFGAGTGKGSEINIAMAKRVKRILGEDSPEWAALRQGMLHRIISTAESVADRGPGTIANRLGNFMSTDMAGVFFTPPQRQLLNEYAGLQRTLSIPSQGANWPNTAAGVIPHIKKATGHILGAIGAAIGHAVSPIVGGAVGFALGEGAGFALQGVENSRNLRQTASQLPLVGQRLRQWQQATMNAATKATVASEAKRAIATNQLALALSRVGMGHDAALRLLASGPESTGPSQAQEGRASGGRIPFAEGGAPTFDERFTGTTPDQSSADDMVDFVGNKAAQRNVAPNEPWAEREAQSNLALQQGDAEKEAAKQRGFTDMASDLWEGTKDAAKRFSQYDRQMTEDVLNLPKRAYENSGDLKKGVQNLLGMGEEPRYQLWPEKMIRSGGSLAKETMSGEVPVYEIDPKTGEWHTSHNLIERTQDLAGMAGSGGLGAGATDATLGSAPFLRPALKYEGKIYKAPLKGQHLDAIPKELYPEFERQAMSGEDISNFNFGFMNHKGHFLDREAALDYAVKEGLIDPRDANQGALTTTLLSDSQKPGAVLSALEKGNVTELPRRAGAEHLDLANEAARLRSTLERPTAEKLRIVEGSGGQSKPLNTPEQVAAFRDAVEGKPKEDTVFGLKVKQLESPEEKFRKGEQFDIPDPSKLRIKKTRSIPMKPGEESKDLWFVEQPTTRKDYVDMGLTHIYDVVTGFSTKEKAEAFIRSQQNKEQIRPENWAGPKLYSDTSKPGAAVAGLARSAEPFYSAAEQTLAGASQKKMHGEQWANWLKNQPGVKPDELQYTGVDKWLREQKGPVTKEQVQDYLKDNKVELEHVEKRHQTPTIDIMTKPELKKLINDWIETHEIEETPERVLKAFESGDSNVRESLQNHLEEMNIEYEGKIVSAGTKHHAYQLPGGENYREHLITLPSRNKVKDRIDELEKQIDALYAKKPRTAAEFMPDDLEKFYKLQDERAALIKQENEQVRQDYKSNHWDEPNVLAHLRTNEREVAGKPSYHIEEIQSDWHQQGRKKGYQSGELPPGPRNFKEFLAERGVTNPAEVQRLWHDRASPEGIDLHNAHVDEIDARNVARSAARQSVPDAPFKKDWAELALKRAIRTAVEEGKDRISWTPGEAQAARYDLSKQLETLSVFRHGGDKYSIVGDLKNGTHEHNFGSDIPEAKLADLVGKEMAEKIIKNKENQQDYKSPDLEVGGEGMKGFYDQILPKTIEKLGKKYGVKVKETNINEPNASPHTAPYRLFNEDVPIGYFGDEQAALRYARNQGFEPTARIEKGKGTPVKYFDIPPAWKEKILTKGFPLFADSSRAAPVSALAKQGETLYHGTSKDKPFRKLKEASNGTWFTTNPEEASMYAKNNDSQGHRIVYDPKMRFEPTNTASRVIPMEHKFENTKVLNKWPDSIRNATNYKRAQAEYFWQLRREGYDSVRMPTEDGHSIVVSLDNTKLSPKYAKGSHKGALYSDTTHPMAGSNNNEKDIDRPRRNEKGEAEVKVPERAAGGRVVASNINIPTSAQAKAGNYAKDHVNIYGLNLTIENAKGSIRKGVSAGGKSWEAVLPCAYGYFKRTEGADGDHVDVYLGPHTKSNKVFVVNQIDHNTKEFDEHKVILGMGSLSQAVNCYEKAFSDGKGLQRIGSIVQTDIKSLKDWLNSGKTKKPFHIQ